MAFFYAHFSKEGTRMSRRRQSTDSLTGHFTKEELEKKKRAEEMVSGEFDTLLKPPAELFGAGIWKGCDWPSDEIKAYKKDLKNAWSYCTDAVIKRRIADNTDKLNLVGLCRAWADIQRIYRNGLKNASYACSKEYIVTISQADSSYRKYASLCGISLDGRLKAGAEAVKKEDEGVEAKFGEI